MKAIDMKYKFDIKMRELLKSLNHPFNTHEINRLLNEAQLVIVRRYADSFDRTEDVKKILSVLVENYRTTNFSTNPQTVHTNGYMITLPTNVLNVESELANGSVHVKPMSLDEYSVNINNPFKKPHSLMFWRLDRLNAQEIITDGTALTSYTCDYIRMPNDIDIDNGVDCELQDQIHEDIVNLAVDIALSIINRRLTKTNNEK